MGLVGEVGVERAGLKVGDVQFGVGGSGGDDLLDGPADGGFDRGEVVVRHLGGGQEKTIVVRGE